MKIKNIFKGLIATILLTIAFTSCESYNEPLLDSLGNTREFSIVGLTTAIRNQTAVELNWTAVDNVDHYVIEFSADDPEFTTIYKTVQVTKSQLPIRIQLEGETIYSIRIKAVTPGLDDSKWTITTANTLSEQIFLPIIPGDIDVKQATLRWIPNSAVTHIFVNPGSISHLITPAEKASGIATITGLSPETNYIATLHNSSKKRGEQTFTTGIDIGTGILVTPTDNLFQKIADAPSGAVLVLMPGDYTAQTDPSPSSPGSKLVTLNKTITLRGLRSYDKPKINIYFTLNSGNSGVNNLSLIDLDMVGTGIASNIITIASAGAVYGDILISGCNLHDFASSPLIYAPVAGAKVKSFTVDNSILKNLATSADFIDFRTSYVADIVLQKSTFDTCSSRDFIREDITNNPLNGTGLTTNALIDKCTFYKLTATRIFYLRFNANASTSRNSLFTNTTAVYANQSTTTQPVFTNNNYFTATSLNTGVASNKPDLNGTALDPQFVSPTTGDFTIKNQALIDAKVGDPRWIK